MKKDDLELELEIYLERAMCAVNNLTQTYFLCSESQNEETNGAYLLSGYSDARINAEIAQDYLNRATEVMEKMEKAE